MLFADKRALETNLKVSLLAIREKELNFYVCRALQSPLTQTYRIDLPLTCGDVSRQTTNCLAVGTQSALLAGFAYSGLTQVAFPHDAPYLIKLLYMLATTTAMGFELIAVMNTTLLSMVGPGLALRGPDGSMHPAVDGMMIEYRLAFYAFFSGLVAFHLSAALFGWMMFWPDHCAHRRPKTRVCVALSHVTCCHNATARTARRPRPSGARGGGLHAEPHDRHLFVRAAAVRDARVHAIPLAFARGDHRPLHQQRGHAGRLLVRAHRRARGNTRRVWSRLAHAPPLS